jgi:hypothetical protein
MHHFQNKGVARIAFCKLLNPKGIGVSKWGQMMVDAAGLERKKGSPRLVAD